MYLGQLRKVEKRKPAKCDHCGEEIPVGEACFVVVRQAKSKKDKKYCWTVYIHTGCFLDWADRAVEKRVQYTAERKGGRPPGSQVQALAKENPELALERHKLIREQARLQRYLVAAEDDDRICSLVHRIDAIQQHLKEILGFQVKKFNRRSEESRHIVREKVARARDIERERKRAARKAPQAAEQAEDERTPEETAEIEVQIREGLERAEAYRRLGQTRREDSRE